MRDYKEESIKLLEELCTNEGIIASKQSIGNYQAVFTRDAVMAGIAGIHIQNSTIIEGLVQSLITLRKTQKKQGQIASNVSTLKDGKIKVSYGTLSHKTDSCCFYLIGVGLGITHGLLNKNEWMSSVYKTVSLLEALEYNGHHLIYVPQGGNWADEYPYHGYLLFDQVLRLWGLRLIATIFHDEELSTKVTHIENSIRTNYTIEENKKGVYHDRAFKQAQEDRKSYLLSGFNPSGYNMEFDLAANAFATFILGGSHSIKSLKWISLQEDPISAFWPIIQPGDSRWHEIRNFHLFEFKNSPGHYHNGGVWWIWLGWLRQSYLKNGLIDEAENLKQWALNFLSNSPNFEFNEYLDKNELNPGGTKWLAYTATGIILLASEKHFDPFHK